MNTEPGEREEAPERLKPCSTAQVTTHVLLNEPAIRSDGNVRQLFEAWWRVNHPFDWWASERNGEPLPVPDRQLVRDLVERAFYSAEALSLSNTTDNKPGEALKPCPFCPTKRREVHHTQGGTIGVIFHDTGCLFAPQDYDRRQVLTPKGVIAWNTRTVSAFPLPVETETSAPKRLWIQPDESSLSGVGPIWFTRKTGDGDIEYIRADLARSRAPLAAVEGDALRNLLNQFLLDKYGCTIEHYRMKVLKHFVEWAAPAAAASSLPAERFVVHEPTGVVECNDSACPLGSTIVGWPHTFGEGCMYAATVLPAAELSAGPRCPKCGYVMCEQFDSRPVNALADIVTPNGTYICYRCTTLPAEPPPTPEQIVYNVAQRDPRFRKYLIEQLTAMGDEQDIGPLRTLQPLQPEGEQEPSLEDLAGEAAALLEQLNGINGDAVLLRANQVAFALRAGIKSSRQRHNLARADGYNDGFRQGKQSRATLPPETLSDAAMRAAKDVVNEILNVPRFVRNPEDTIIEIEEKVAAIITRHLAAPAFVLSRIAALAHEGRNITHAGTHSLLAEIEEIAAAATTSPETPAPVQAAGDDEGDAERRRV